MIRRFQNDSLWCAALSFGILAGCSTQTNPDTAPVTGTITQNGQPLASGRVVFYPTGTKGDMAGKPARGSLQSDGTFALSTYGDSDGAVIGSHNVTVLSSGTEGEARAIGALNPTTVTVSEGDNSFEFILTAMPKQTGGRRNLSNPDPEEPEDDE